jgi:hypothetical protein
MLGAVNTVTRSIELIGTTKVAQRVNLYPSAVQKWRDQGRLPITELAGLTQYAREISLLSIETGEPVTVERLLVDTRAAWEAHKEAS